MVFSSVTFLWIFLPLALGTNYLLSLIKKHSLKMLLKNISLLVLSLIFYAGGGLKYVLLMVASILGNYLIAILIANCQQKEQPKLKKMWLILGIIFNLGLLGFFKYFTFVMRVFKSITGLNFSIMKIILPVGISFFTFQAISYIVEVYKGKVECQKNFINLALYISFFPQLIAGPIVEYSHMKNQIENRQETVEQFFAGIKRFLYGLAKKVIISNMLGEVAQTVFAQDLSTLDTNTAWLAMLCYCLQIYYDFSGYSDMAIGLGKMFGFEFPENFNYPYLATSITEFWRRWHISLSTWFKNYVYIPLGGNRKGIARTCLNLSIVFLLTGLWHGANYTFLVWGAAFAVFMVLERLFLGKLLEKNKLKFLNRIYTLLVVMLLFAFFRAGSIAEAFETIKIMFSFRGGTYPLFQAISLEQWIILGVGILLCGPVQKWFGPWWNKVRNKTVSIWVDYTFQFCLYVVCVNLLLNNSFNPFIYFQF